MEDIERLIEILKSIDKKLGNINLKVNEITDRLINRRLE